MIVFELGAKEKDVCNLGSPVELVKGNDTFDVYEFTVGFDDLVFQEPGSGSVIVKRYGKHWNLGCHVKTSAKGEAKPDAGGFHDVDTVTAITEYKVNLDLLLVSLEHFLLQLFRIEMR